MTQADPADPFDTAGQRAAVLTAWRASPARLREDANAEEALARGGYADRALVELIANGVDAAIEAGEHARVRVELVDGELRVANTGAALTAAGVAALASLRASAKSGTVTLGRFGVGFTAVLGLTDRPTVLSTTGTVRFNAEASAMTISELGDERLDAVVSARDGHVPVLRLPFLLDAAASSLPAGYVTQVRLPLRTGVIDAVRDEIDALDEQIFWAVPGLVELVVAGEGGERRLTRHDHGSSTTISTTATEGTSTRLFTVVTAHGKLDAQVLADRPTEERARAGWRISWILGPGTADRTLGAPLATDEALSLPAQLIGTFPVDETRRRLAPGPATDLLLARAGNLYLQLVAAVPAERRWTLVPGTDFPRGPVDARLREAIAAGFGTEPLLPTLLGDAVSARTAVVLPGVPAEAATLIAQAVPGLLADPITSLGRQAVRSLRIRQLEPADATVALAALDRPPDFWGALYAALAEVPDAQEWADLPIPLAGGRMRTGARGTLLSGELSEQLSRAVADAFPGLPLVDPAAAAAFLTRIGAEPGDPDVLLDHPAVHARLTELREALEDGEAEVAEVDDVARAVLGLLAAGGRPRRALPIVLSEADDDEPWPAAELLLPEAPLAALVPPDTFQPIHPRWRRHHSDDVLRAAGVRDTLVAVTLPESENELAVTELPDAQEWLDDLDLAAPPPGSRAIADLDLVTDDAWPAAVTMIATDPGLRATLGSEGPSSYSGWWIGRFARVGGTAPRHFRRADAIDLAGLYDEFPVAVDADVAAAMGVVTSWSDAARDAGDLIRRYADEGRLGVPLAVPALTVEVVRLVAVGAELPVNVRSLSGRAVPADDVLVLDEPWWAQVLGLDELVPAAGDAVRTAEVLDLELASSLSVTVSLGSPVPLAADAAAAGAAVAGVALPRIRVVDRLAVRLEDRSSTVTWWPDGDGFVTDGSAAGIGRAIAWTGDRWSARAAIVAAVAGTPFELAEITL